MIVALRSGRPGWQIGRSPAVPCLLILALCLQALDSRAEPRPHPARQAASLFAVSQVSEHFHRQAKSASETIPGHIWRTLHRAGWRVRMAEFVVDADPSLRGNHPRGWPKGSSWENADAVNVPSKRLVVIGEKRRQRSGAVVPNTRVAEVLRHEVGHAFDLASGGRFRLRSARPDFVSAYRHDIRRIARRDREPLRYYLQDDHAGRQEAFAEAFAIILGGGSDTPHREHFVRSFLNVLKLVERTIDQTPAPGGHPFRAAQR